MQMLLYYEILLHKGIPHPKKKTITFFCQNLLSRFNNNFNNTLLQPSYLKIQLGILNCCTFFILLVITKVDVMTVIKLTNINIAKFPPHFHIKYFQ